MINSVAINNLNASLQQFAEAAAKISDPNRAADLSDIVQLKQAQANAEIGAAVLAKINESQRLVDIIA